MIHSPPTQLPKAHQPFIYLHLQPIEENSRSSSKWLAISSTSPRPACLLPLYLISSNPSPSLPFLPPAKPISASCFDPWSSDGCCGNRGLGIKELFVLGAGFMWGWGVLIVAAWWHVERTTSSLYRSSWLVRPCENIREFAGFEVRDSLLGWLRPGSWIGRISGKETRPVCTNSFKFFGVKKHGVTRLESGFCGSSLGKVVSVSFLPLAISLILISMIL
ncbi:hypothetical protein Droror1_Dr00028220 [Drosera rotundifolia]